MLHCSKEKIKYREANVLNIMQYAKVVLDALQ